MRRVTVLTGHLVAMCSQPRDWSGVGDALDCRNSVCDSREEKHRIWKQRGGSLATIPKFILEMVI